MKRLPYGISNFACIIDEQYYYVDKTPFIEILEKESNRYHFFIRPRKFGKSLFISTLLHYYDMNNVADFQKMFGNLYIGKNPTPKRNSYAMLEFNFSGMDTSDEDSFKLSFSRKTQMAVSFFFEKYRKKFPEAETYIQKINNENPGFDALNVVYNAAIVAGVKIFIIIDEYDHFANDLIAIGGDQMYRRMVRANGIIRDFYETLKIGTSSVVDRIFITGISPVMLDDLTSGFNIAVNLTTLLPYNDMMGFTQDETERLKADVGVDDKYINVDMKKYYNGYLFHKNAANRIYNPSMILYFFDQILRSKTVPDHIIDDNLKTDYGRIQRLLKNDANREKLIEIIKENGIISNIITKFSIDRLDDNEYFISLLFYMGLLTIDKVIEGNTRLMIPNYSIQTVYWEYIKLLTNDLNSEVRIDDTQLRLSVSELAYRGNPQPYIYYISKNIFSRLSNRDLIGFDEKYIKIMLLDGLFHTNIYVPFSEHETDAGYVDMYLKRSPLFPEIPYEWIFELKYVKESQRKHLPTVRKDAQEQLNRYSQTPQMAERNDLKMAVIIFIGKKKYEIITIQ